MILIVYLERKQIELLSINISFLVFIYANLLSAIVQAFKVYKFVSQTLKIP